MPRVLLIHHNHLLKAHLDHDTRLANTQAHIDFITDISNAQTLLSKHKHPIIICAFSALKKTPRNYLPSTSKLIICDEQSSVEHACHAFKIGASEYIDEHDKDILLSTIHELLTLETPRPKRNLIGDCQEMQQVFHHIEKAAPTDCSVLILGETGTGKELVAQSLHSSSSRSKNPLISVNCAAIPETLIESELFGYEKGAFTGANTSRQGLIEAANSGTLFLDEIGELPLEAQARLLRFIQEGEIRRIGSVTPRKVNVRLIAATHRNLKQLCSQNKFREDLFYRINVMQINLPALRDRGDDVHSIANHILHTNCLKLNHPPKTFSAGALAAISTYSWPGNIRELHNIIERAIILSEQSTTEISEDLLTIDVEYTKEPSNVHLPHTIPTAQDTIAQQDTGADKDDNASLSLEDYFMSFVLEHQDTMSETELAKKLGVSRKCLWERRQRLGIPRKKDNKAAAKNVTH